MRRRVGGASERAGRDCGRLAVNIRVERTGLSCAGEQAEVKVRKIQGLLSTAGMASAGNAHAAATTATVWAPAAEALRAKGLFGR